MLTIEELKNYEIDISLFKLDSDLYNRMVLKMNEMLELQEALNLDTNGPDWRLGVTNKDRPIDWFLCAIQEASEFINSFNWKHWKNINAPHNFDNAIIELVDIWHFLMSESLRQTPIVKLQHLLTQQYIEAINCAQGFVSAVENNGDEVPFEKALIHETIRTSKVLMANCADELISESINDFFTLCYFMNLKFEKLYSLYIGKNALNIFRQTHGYREGTYIKEWNGVEDNVIMQAILNSNPGISYTELIQALEDHYSQIQ